MKRTTLAVSATLFLVTACASAADAGYKVLKKTVLGGDGGWDYVTADPDARRVYIARESRILVVDMDALKVVKEIPANGAHGVALAPEFNRGFISNGKDNTVTLFDLKTLEKVGQAATGLKPDAIVYDAASKRVFVGCGKSESVTALDAKTGAVVGEIKLGGAPEFAAFDGKGMMFVNLEDKSEVVAVDTNKLAALQHWPLPAESAPTGLAIDAEHHRVFSGCHNQKMQVLDTDSGKIVASLPIGKGVDACAFDPGPQLAFASTGDGNLTIVHEDTPDKFTVVQTLPTMPGARTMALDPKTHQIWLVAGERGPDKKVTPGTFTLLTVGKE